MPELFEDKLDSVVGSNNNEEAKMAGITPDMFNFIGK